MELNEAKRYRIIIVILILVNLSLISIWWLLSIKSDSNDSSKHQNNKKDFFKEALKLDSIQQNQFDTLNHQHFQKLGKLNHEVDSLKQKMRIEIMQPTQNQERLDSVFTEIAIKRTIIDSSIYHHFQRLRKICKPNQINTFDSVVNSFLLHKEKNKKRSKQIGCK